MLRSESVVDVAQGGRSAKRALLGLRPVENAGLLSQLAEGLTAVDRYGMGEWLQRWRRWDYLKGRSVVVDGVPPVTGIAAGIDDGGALLVNTASGQSVVAGGEASLLQIGGAP